MAHLKINDQIQIPEAEIILTAMRSQGAGGQNVNKVSTAIHLRFNIHNSSLTDFHKQRLLAYADQRITKEGEIIIKAQSFRSQEKNKADAFNRLAELIILATARQKKRRPTKPSLGAQKRRLAHKNKRSQLKASRKKDIQD